MRPPGLARRYMASVLQRVKPSPSYILIAGTLSSST